MRNCAETRTHHLDPDRHRASGLVGAVRRHPSGILLLAQLLAMLAYPFSDGSTVGRAFLGRDRHGVVLIALWAVRRTPALGLGGRADRRAGGDVHHRWRRWSRTRSGSC